jgi:hypothetical protein
VIHARRIPLKVQILVASVGTQRKLGVDSLIPLIDCNPATLSIFHSTSFSMKLCSSSVGSDPARADVEAQGGNGKLLDEATDTEGTDIAISLPILDEKVAQLLGDDEE